MVINMEGLARLHFLTYCLFTFCSMMTCMQKKKDCSWKFDESYCEAWWW